LAAALKLVSLQGEQMPYAALAKQMRLSPFEAHRPGGAHVALAIRLEHETYVARTARLISGQN